MKIGRLFTIDVEIAERMKHLANASSVVNRLLKEYFEIKGDKNTLLDEKQAILSNIKKKKKKSRRTLRLLLSSIRSGLTILLDDGLKLVGKGQRTKKLDPTQEEGKYFAQRQ